VIDELTEVEAVKTGESAKRKRSDGEQLKKSRKSKKKSKKKVNSCLFPYFGFCGWGFFSTISAQI